MRPAPTLHPAAALLAKTALTSERLAMVKRSYNTRRIAVSELSSLWTDPTVVPQAGQKLRVTAPEELNAVIEPCSREKSASLNAAQATTGAPAATMPRWSPG